LRVRQVVLR